MNQRQLRDQNVREQLTKHLRLWGKQSPGIDAHMRGLRITARIVEVSPSVDGCALKDRMVYIVDRRVRVLEVYVHRDWVNTVLHNGVSEVNNGFILRATKIPDLPVWQVCVLRPYPTQLSMTEELLIKTPAGLITHHNMLAALAEHSASIPVNSVLQSIPQALASE